MKELYKGVPFLDADGRPKVYSLLCQNPVEGRIIDRYEWQGVPLALYEREPGITPTWRVLVPDNPVRCDYVLVGPGEGLPGVHDQVARVIGTVVDWKGREYHGEKDKEWIGAMIRAGSEMTRRGRSAPTAEEGGYLKTDFRIVWADGTEYQGRFDLQKGGTDAGETFSTSVRQRMFFYSGLYCPYHVTFDSYMMILGRDQQGFSKTCRQILAACEL